MPSDRRPCLVPDCPNTVDARNTSGLCRSHANEARRGSALPVEAGRKGGLTRRDNEREARRLAELYRRQHGMPALA